MGARAFTSVALVVFLLAGWFGPRLFGIGAWYVGYRASGGILQSELTTLGPTGPVMVKPGQKLVGRYQAHLEDAVVTVWARDNLLRMGPPAFQQITQAGKGVITFEGLKPGAYFVEAKIGRRQNDACRENARKNGPFAVSEKSIACRAFEAFFHISWTAEG